MQRETGLASVLVCGLLCGGACGQGELVAVDKVEFDRIFPAQAQVTRLAGDLQFTEGPVWYGREPGVLIFSDIPANKLLQWHPDRGLSVFRDPSHNANGNTVDREGRLVTCEHGRRLVSITQPDGSVETLVDTFEGNAFNSPNDLVVKSDGTVWFTDPDYGLAGRPKEQPGNFVYRYDPATDDVAAVVRDFDRPNGLCFSPDESRLYIADSGSPRHIRVFPVRADGSLEAGRVFVKIDQGGPDGIRCDEGGRVWSSSGDGAQVFTADGNLVARVRLPQAGANLCFGGADGRTLFVTARTGLYAVATQVRGASWDR